MVRTQLYLTEDERDGLLKLAQRTGKKQSELVREAVDTYLETHTGDEQIRVVDDVAAIWKDRTDLPDFTELRREWDRGNVVGR